MTYRDELTKAMTMLGEHPKTIFMGQAVAYPGTGMFNMLEGVPMKKRLELPVMEDAQLGMAIGMSLRGFIPICIYPRINFLLLAMNQLVLHLDKLPLYGNGWKPKVIIRTMVAHDQPMDPGVQHLGEFSYTFDDLQCVTVERIYKAHYAAEIYEEALKNSGSSLLIEYAGMYEND